MLRVQISISSAHSTEFRLVTVKSVEAASCDVFPPREIFQD